MIWCNRISSGVERLLEQKERMVTDGTRRACQNHLFHFEIGGNDYVGYVTGLVLLNSHIFPVNGDAVVTGEMSNEVAAGCDCFPTV